MAVKQSKKQLLFHGTSLNRLNQILECGYLGTTNNIWDVSEANTTYFWTESFIREEYSAEEPEQIKYQGLQLALESAAFALAQEKHDLKRAVLIFKSEDLENLGLILSEDKTCKENMDHCLRTTGKIPIELAEIWIDEEDLTPFYLYFLGLATSRNNAAEESKDGCYAVYLESEDSALTEAALKVYESLADYFLENLEDPSELKQVTIQQLKDRSY